MSGTKNNTTQSSATFLSNAIWSIPPSLGYINIIEAPMGCGKTHYTKKLIAPKGKKTILITGLNAISDQVSTTVYQRSNNILDTIWVFGDNLGLHINATHIIYSIQYLIRMVDKAEFQHFIRTVGIMIVDEVDWLCLDLPHWTATDTPKYDKFFGTLVESRDSILTICMSATGIERTIQYFHTLLLNCTRKCEVSKLTPLKHLERHYHTIPSPAALIFWAKVYKKQIGVYVNSVKEGVGLKELAEELGLRSAFWCSKTAKNHTMDEFELGKLDEVMRTGKLDGVDVLIFNDAVVRGVSVNECGIEYVGVFGECNRANEQASGRFRYKVGVFKKEHQHGRVNWEEDFSIRVGDKVRFAKGLGFRSWKELKGFWGDREIDTKEGRVWFRGDLSKREQPVQIESVLKQPYEYNIWYTLEELEYIFSTKSLQNIENCLLQNERLTTGRPRINGNRVRRYKIQKA